MKRPAPRQGEWTSYVGYQLRPEVKAMPEEARFQLAAFLVEILENPDDKVDVDCFSSVGLSDQADFFLRFQAPTLTELQEISVDVAASGLGRYLDVTHTWLGVNRASPYGEAAAGEDEVEDAPWFVVAPFVLSPAWYALDEDERKTMYEEYTREVAQKEGVYPFVSYCEGLGDAACVVGYHCADLAAYEGLARALKGTRLAAFHEPSPFHMVGRAVPAHEALELCGAL